MIINGYDLSKILSLLSEKYMSLDWHISMDEPNICELTTSIGIDKVYVSSSRYGHYLQIIKKGGYVFGHLVSEKECPIVRDIFRNIWNYVNNK